MKDKNSKNSVDPKVLVNLVDLIDEPHGQFMTAGSHSYKGTAKAAKYEPTPITTSRSKGDQAS